MQINKVEFEHRAGKEVKSISFLPHRVNIIAVGNDFDKASFSSAIPDILYGQKSDTAADTEALPSGPIKAGTIWLDWKDKKLTLHRKFSEQMLMIDEEGNSDKQPQATEKNENGAAGRKLTGLSQALYRRIMVMEQDQEKRMKFMSHASIGPILEQYESEAKHTSNLQNAIACLEHKLNNFSFNSTTYSIDELLLELDNKRSQLQQQLEALASAKASILPQQDELKQTEAAIDNAKVRFASGEYFAHCLELADLDTRIIKVKERLLYEASLKGQLNQLSKLSTFPISSLKQVEESWAKREARLSDMARLTEEMALIKEENYEGSYFSDDDDIYQYTKEDGQILYGLGKTLKTVQTEYDDLARARAEEMRRVKELGVDFDRISLVRKALLSIGNQDLEKANILFQEMKEAKESLSNIVKEMSLLEEQQKELAQEYEKFSNHARKVRTGLLGATSVPAALLISIAINQKHYNLDSITLVSLTGFIILLGVTCLFPQILSGLKTDMLDRQEKNKQDLKKASQNEEGASHKLTGIQTNANHLAKKCNLSGSTELFKHLQNYAPAQAQLKELDLLDHLMESRQAQIEKLCGEIESYFTRINRKLTKATLSASANLADEIYRFHETQQKLDRSNALLSHKLSEKKFLEGEISDIHSFLRDRYYAAGLSDPEEIEQSYLEFQEKAANYIRWESLSQEYERLQQDITAELLNADLSSVLLRLEERRRRAWGRMKELVLQNPTIMSISPDAEGIKRPARNQLLAELSARISSLQEHAHQIKDQLRENNRKFEVLQPRTELELETLALDQERLNRFKIALTSARNKLRIVQDENWRSWSQQLSEISEELLYQSDLELNNINWDENLQLSLKLRENQEAITEKDAERKLSRSALFQLNWIVQMTLCRLLARDTPLPILLDEPFADLDDNYFLAAMRLLIHKMLPHCQVIILSCHQIRHQWLLNQLLPEEQDLVNLIIPA